MIMTDTELKQAHEAQYILNQTRRTEKYQPDFWLLSDIVKTHPNFLDKNRLIPVYDFHEKLKKTVFKSVPAFHDVFPHPVHVKTIINPTDSSDKQNKLDQQITNVGCEFYFQQFRETEFTQAYFLFPNASFLELVHNAENINLYRTAKKIQNVTKILVATITSKTIDYDSKKTFEQIWYTLWSELFATKDIDGLKAKHNITTNAPTTHLIPSQWTYIYYMLQDLMHYIDNTHTELMTEDVLKLCRESAQIQRHMFEKHTEHGPEYFLTKTDFKEIVKNVETQRTNFWLVNYKQSLI